MVYVLLSAGFVLFSPVVNKTRRYLTINQIFLSEIFCMCKLVKRTIYLVIFPLYHIFAHKEKFCRTLICEERNTPCKGGVRCDAGWEGG